MVDPLGLFAISANALTASFAVASIIPSLSTTNGPMGFLGRLTGVDAIILNFSASSWSVWNRHLLRSVTEPEKIELQNLVRQKFVSALSGYRVGVFFSSAQAESSLGGLLAFRTVSFRRAKALSIFAAGITPLTATGFVSTQAIADSFGAPIVRSGSEGRISSFIFEREKEDIAHRYFVVGMHELLRTFGWIGSLGECGEYFMCKSVIDERGLKLHPRSKALLDKQLKKR